MLELIPISQVPFSLIPTFVLYVGGKWSGTSLEQLPVHSVLWVCAIVAVADLLARAISNLKNNPKCAR